MAVSERTRAVLEDLRQRESRRRLRNWRRMVKRYADTGLISRKPMKCPQCGRVVDMVCDDCQPGIDLKPRLVWSESKKE